MLELDSLARSEDGTALLEGISARLEPGRLYTLLGRTGAGKTSLMRAIAGTQMLDSGSVRLDGQDWARLPPWKRSVAMVYQQFINYPHLTVLENVAFPLRRRGMAKREARDRAQDALVRVGLRGFENRRPGALSGGQQQRVALARALVKQSRVLLLDEPLVNLDYKLREQLREELVELLARDRATTVLYATTEPREALQMGDAVLVMAQGRLLQSGAPRAVFAAPGSVAIAQIVSDPPMNILPLTLVGGRADLGPLGAPDLGALVAGLPDGRYSLGLRAGDLLPEPGLTGRVILSEISGSETMTHLAVGGQHLILQQKSVVTHALGADVPFRPHWPAAFLFDADGRLIRHPGERRHHG